MNKLLFKLIVFLLFVFLTGEVIVRLAKLTADIPQRFVDETGIQRYIPGQSGYLARSDYKWVVNDYGWIGKADTSNSENIISIVGDSFIENIMNPISCNQGTLLGSYYKNISFFEAGRSGVTFIESMEITKLLDTTIAPRKHLLYIGKGGLYKSISNKQRFTDAIQLDLEKKSILKGKLKYPKLKYILYNIKLLYYLYIKFPLLVSDQNKGEIVNKLAKRKEIDLNSVNELFQYCNDNYNMNNIIFVIRPGVKKEIIKLAKEFEFKMIVLNSEGDKSWGLGNHDGHWSCYGHDQAAKQIQTHLKLLIE